MKYPSVVQAIDFRNIGSTCAILVTAGTEGVGPTIKTVTGRTRSVELTAEFIALIFREAVYTAIWWEATSTVGGAVRRIATGVISLVHAIPRFAFLETHISHAILIGAAGTGRAV